MIQIGLERRVKYVQHCISRKIREFISIMELKGKHSKNGDDKKCRACIRCKDCALGNQDRSHRQLVFCYL